MLKFDQFSSMSSRKAVDAENGVIRGVCVARVGEAKGHGVELDRESLVTLLALTKSRPDGIATRFGDDHEAKAKDFNGSLKNWTMDDSGIYADLHLLSTDPNNKKLLEMAEKIPNEFGLSVVSDAKKEKSGVDSEGKPTYRFVSPIRFSALECVDIVSSPAATNGLFFSTKPTMNKEFALKLGLPETATEAEVLVKLSEMCNRCNQYDADAEAASKKLDADASVEEVKEVNKEEEKKSLEADDEEKNKQGEKAMDAKDGDAAGKVAEHEGEGKAGIKPATEGSNAKKFEALEAQVLELSNLIKGLTANTEAAKAAAHKAEIENLKLEAGKDGKVIALSDEALLKLSVPEVKEMISKLPKGQVKLSAKTVAPAAKSGEKLNYRSKEFIALMAAKRAEGALALGQIMAPKR